MSVLCSPESNSATGTSEFLNGIKIRPAEAHVWDIDRDDLRNGFSFQPVVLHVLVFFLRWIPSPLSVVGADKRQVSDLVEVDPIRVIIFRGFDQHSSNGDVLAPFRNRLAEKLRMELFVSAVMPERQSAHQPERREETDS